MRIQHNIMAMNAYRNYNNNTSALSSNLEKLSSGYKINRAGDDAAGLAISEKMRAQISGLDQAESNVKDGISLVKTGEGALQEVQDMLNRMVTLATQSANGTYDNDTDRAQLQKEVDSLTAEIDRIADSSNFNGIQLLDGSLSGKSQVSNLATTVSTAIVGQYNVGSAGFTATAFGAGTTSTLKDADIGSKISFTVTWKDSSSGDLKNTVVDLTFQGDGTGTVSSTAKDNYFTDANGTKYNLDTSGNFTANNIAAAFEAGLKADNEFTANFENISVSNTGTTKGVTVDSIEKGSAGAVLESIAVSSNFKSVDANTAVNTAAATGLGCGDATIKQTALDALQKFSINDVKVALNSDTATVYNSDVFELDGHKFLAVASDFADSKIKALDSDITVIKLSTTANKPAAADAENISAQITKVTGYMTRVATTSDGTANTTGITAGTDILFTEDKLKTTGNELTLQIGDTADSYNQMGVKIDDMHTAALGIDKIDISNQDSAAEAIDVIKAAINQVSSTRGTLGATQNRLEHTQNNLSVMAENIQDAESTIRDTDVAEEMMSYTKNNILVQSAQAMLAQANSVPQGVLQLLQ
jgi:flagellin